MSFIKDNWKFLLVLFLVLAVAAFTWSEYKEHKNPAVVAQLTPEQLKDKAVLMETLNKQQGQIEALMKAMQIAQGQPPSMSFTVQAPSIPAAANKVTEDIKAGTSPAVQVPGQQTIVTPNVQANKVDVYRVTTEHARIGVSVLAMGGRESQEFGAGAGWINRDNAIAVGATTKGRVYLLWIGAR